jgi:hypothetical protein
MASKKKLQVFVSSTYQDLQEERQAAVEAILTAGHIPAGMELFAAGDEAQMHVIRRWIDESDVYLLILGGRYGSLEPTTDKSYIHLEYDYAVEQRKPVFAVVINDDHLEEKVRVVGSSVIERENPGKLKVFREKVLTKLVRFFSDPRDIKLAIHETMAEFANRSDLIGWVPGDQSVNTGAVAEELARLARENADLRNRASESQPVQTFMGLSFTELHEALSGEAIKLKKSRDFRDNEFVDGVRATARRKKRKQPALLDALWYLKDALAAGYEVYSDEDNTRGALRRLAFYGVINKVGSDLYENTESYRLTPEGQRFLLRLTVSDAMVPMHGNKRRRAQRSTAAGS